MSLPATITVLVISMVIAVTTGCLSPAEKFVRKTDALPAEARPPGWEGIKAKMARSAPKVGEVAPDFTLKSPEGSETITRSRFQGDRPLVLIFGSYT